MRIEGLEQYTADDLREALDQGGRFVFFEYCVSGVFFSIRRPTAVYFLPAQEWAWVRALPYSALTALLGWWGLPWGVIYSPLALVTNFAGGCDVTDQTLEYLAQLPQWSELGADVWPTDS